MINFKQFLEASEMTEEIHPDVIKAYKKTQDAEHKHGEYGTTATKRSVTRSSTLLSKKINQHHPGLDSKGKIKLRTELQNMHEGDPCWKGYEMVGMKKKGKKQVPNCVPVSESGEDFSKLRDHARWHPARYDKMKKGGMMHNEIQKVWDDEVEAEKEAANMNKNNAAGK